MTPGIPLCSFAHCDAPPIPRLPLTRFLILSVSERIASDWHTVAATPFVYPVPIRPLNVRQFVASAVVIR